MTRQEVARWAQKARRAVAARDEAIVAYRATGASLRDVAEAAGLSHTAVAKIVARHSDAPR